MVSLPILVLLLLEVPRIVRSVAIDNGVEGQPSISCGENYISLWVATRKPFLGKVYVKGEYAHNECVNSYAPPDNNGETTSSRSTQGPTDGNNGGRQRTNGPSDQCPPCPCQGSTSPFAELFRNRRQARKHYQTTTTADFGESILSTTTTTKSTAEAESSAQVDEKLVEDNDPLKPHLTVKLGTCNVKRERQLNPRGVAVQFTVVVSFHPSFITKVDKAYQVRCFYMEAEKTVTSELDVSMPPTTELRAQATMPICEYSIRRESSDGTEIKYARVGDPIYHVWECKTAQSDMFGMLVHSCYVNDGQGQKVELITDKGCSVDKFVVGDLSYQTPLLALVESHVFKFADRAVLDFQCQISICVKVAGACEGVTPPTCSKSRRLSRDLVADRMNRTDVLHDTPTSANSLLRDHEWDLHAQRLVIVDLDDEVASDQLKQLENLDLSGRANKTLALGSSASSAQSAFHSSSPALGNSNNFNGRVASEQGNGSSFMNYFSPKVCLSALGFGLLVGVCTFIFTLTSVVLSAVYLIRRKGLPLYLS